MALIVETGQGVIGANSYRSLVDAQSYLDDRGITTTLTEALMLRAMVALSSATWVGRKADRDNPLPWPRVGVYDREGYLQLQEQIPSGIPDGQTWLAHYIDAGVDPGTRTEYSVRSETVGPLSTTYAVRAGEKDAVTLFSLPYVRMCLQDYWNPGGMIDRA